MFNFFKRPNVIAQDNSEFIYLNDEGTKFYPLVCADNYLYAQGLNDIRTLIREWVALDRSTTLETGQNVAGTVSILLNTVDLKLLPNTLQINRVLEILSSDAINNSGSRFLDTIAFIHAVIPTEILETYKGKFLYGMLYGLPEVLSDDIPRATKKDWLYCLSILPYAPFIPFVQEVFALEALGDLMPNTTLLKSEHQE
jgi:hypothetical protein